MDEYSEMSEGTRQARALREALEANDRAVQQFLSRASQVHSAYSYALGQVRRELNALENAFQGAAAAALGAFAGMLNSVRPALNKFASTVTGIFGVTYWKSSSKGMDAAASSLGRVARATRSVARAQRDLYSFDRITRVSASGGSGGGSSGSGGSGAGGGAAGDGEWVRVPGLLDEFARKAKDVLGEIWKPFHDAWRKQGQQTMDAALAALTAVGRAAGAVGKSWLKVWTGGAGEKAVRSVLTIVEQLCRTVEALADNFRKAWQAGGLGDGIMNRLFSLAQSVLDTLSGMAAATARWAQSVDFGPVLRAFSGVLNAAQPLVDLLGGALSRVYREVLLPLASWTIQEAMPAGLNLLRSALEALTSALNALKPVAEFVWNNVLQPMGAWVPQGLISGVQSASNSLTLLSQSGDVLRTGWTKLKESAGTIWKGIQDTISKYAGEGGKSASSAFKTMRENSVSSAKTMSGSLKDIFGTISSNIKNKLSGVSGHIVSPFKSGFSTVVSLVNKVIKNLNNSLKLSWPTVKASGKTLIEKGTVRLANMPVMERLAQGGITTGPAFSLIGEEGREAVLPLERNTGWMDELARRIAPDRGPTVVEVHVGSERLVRQVVDGINTVTARTGVCPIYI